MYFDNYLWLLHEYRDEARRTGRERDLERVHGRPSMINVTKLAELLDWLRDEPDELERETDAEY